MSKRVKKFIFLVDLGFIVSPAQANIIQNGDFDNGEISPWSCKKSTCTNTKEFLKVRKRTEVYSGPWQLLDNQDFTTDSDLDVTFAFDLKSDEEVTVTWKMKITKDGGKKWFEIST